MGTSLLQVLRTVALDAAERSAFEADPSGYLSQYGYEDLPSDDLEEAVDLMADTLPAEDAMAIAPGNGDGGLVGAVRGVGDDDPAPVDNTAAEPPDLAATYGDADFDSIPGDADLDSSPDPDPEPLQTDATGPDPDISAPDAPSPVEFGAGSEPDTVDGPDEPAVEATAGQELDGTAFDDAAGPLFEDLDTDLSAELEDETFDEAEGFTLSDSGPADTAEPDIDDIGLF